MSHRISTSASQTQSRWGQPLLPPRPSHVRDSLRGNRKMRLRSPVDERTLVVQSRDSSTPSEGQKNGGHPTHLAFRAIALHTTCAITPRPSPMRATRDSKQGWSLYSLHSQQTSCTLSQRTSNVSLHSQPCPHATTADDHRHYHPCRIAQLELELHRTRAEAEASRGDFELLREVVSD